MGERLNPESLWFGRARSGCFGMVHQPDQPSERGVVICNTLGFDGMVAHRAFRLLADELTARGFWVVRFDYDGEGDSAGGPWEPNRVAAWTESIHDAVGVLHERGVSDVQLVGLRIGASLAYRYATMHEGISGLALWAPCVTGSSYVRELKALARLSKAARPAQNVTPDRFPADSLEVVGFEFSAETMADLATIELTASSTPIGRPPLLVIDRDDAPPSDDFVRSLAVAGEPVEHELMPGYFHFMTNDELRSVIPWATLNRVIDWLEVAKAPAVEDAPVWHKVGAAEVPVTEAKSLVIDDATASRYTPTGAPEGSVIEEQVWIDDRFFAIISSPDEQAPIRRASIVLCNPGWTRHTGQGRWYVDAARYWASLGFTVVRVDLGGAGDSFVDAPIDNLPYAPVRVEELREVTEWVRGRTGFDSVALLGSCSGAFNAFHAVLDGVEAEHAILVNPLIFYVGDDDTVGTSPEARLFAAQALKQGVMNPRKWLLALHEPHFLRRGLKRASDLVRAGATDGLKYSVGAKVRNTARRVGLPVKKPVSVLAHDFELIEARGAKVFMIFATGESGARYVPMFGGAELDASLRAAGQLVNINGGDHSFASPGARQRLFEELTKYLNRDYPRSRAASSTNRTVLEPVDAHDR